MLILFLALCRRVIHTVGPKYAVKYHTAAENALSHCYRSCLELLIENGLKRLSHCHKFSLLHFSPLILIIKEKEKSSKIYKKTDLDFKVSQFGSCT